MFAKVKSYKYGKKIILLLVFSSLLLFIYFYYHSDSKERSVSFLSPYSKIIIPPTITPTPFPFAELTIPYLRNRQYESSLGPLEELSENQYYRSFLTSYDSDGLTVNALLTQPKIDILSPNAGMPASGWPAVVFVHGYIPPNQYRTTENYSSYVDYLARRGLAVFKIDLRGHAASEGEAGGAYYSADYVIDTLNALVSMKTVPFINGDQIGLWGHSMAGNVVFRSLVVKKDIPATVIWAGAVYTYSDMSKFGINDNSYRPPSEGTNRQKSRQLLRQIYGDFTPESEFWQQVVPTNFLEDVSGSLQIHHAQDDNIVSIGYSRNLANILEKSPINFRLVEYQSGGHNISGSVFNQSMADTVDFFKRNLR